MARWPSYKQKAETWSDTGYDPHRVQRGAHASETRTVMVVGGERAGKSRWVAEEILACIPWVKEVVLVGERYTNCHKEMQYILDGLALTGNLRQKSTPSVGQWNIYTHTGAHIRTCSVNDGAEELAATGESYDIVALLECGMMRKSASLTARGRVAESRGRIFLSGTLLSNFGWYADMYRMFKGPNIYKGERFSMPSWENTAIYPGGEQDPEIQLLREALPPDDFDRRIAALLRPSKALIYPDFDPAIHMGDYSYDNHWPVTLALDPGYYPSAFAVLAAQCKDDKIYLVDEVYEHRMTVPDIVEVCKSRDWWKRVEVVYGDVASKQHHSQKSVAEIWRELTGIHIRSKKVGKLDGIMRVMTFLKDPATRLPRMFLDVKCVETAREFGSYMRKTDRLDNVTSDLPDEGDSSTGHAMDTIAYLLVGVYGFVAQKSRKPRRGRSKSHVDRG